MGQYRGVNLGGWLVLEQWITPSVFKGSLAKDEYGFCKNLGERKLERLQQHRSSWITEQDFAWIAEHGLNAIRLPVPHWLFGGFEPFVACSEYVDWAFKMADTYGLAVLLDLHTAPGSQNGYDHSGQAGQPRWHTNSANIEATLNVVQQIVDRYGNQPALVGLAILNEPLDRLPRKVLTDYYERCKAIAGNVTLVISDAFNTSGWQDYAAKEGFILDSHRYQLFGEADKRLTMLKHIRKAKYDWADELTNIPGWYMIGEWTAQLDKKAFRGFDVYDRDKGYQAYANAQMKAFSGAWGWFYWTLKTEDGGAWSMQESVSRGWLPNGFTDL